MGGVNMALGYSAHCTAIVGTDVSLWHKFEFDCFGSASVYGLHITKYLGSLFPPPLQFRQGEIPLPQYTLQRWQLLNFVSGRRLVSWITLPIFSIVSKIFPQSELQNLCGQAGLNSRYKVSGLRVIFLQVYGLCVF